MLFSEHKPTTALIVDLWGRIRKKLKSGEIATSGEQWPMFLYRNHKFNPENPWDGLMQGQLLVNIRLHFVLLLLVFVHISHFIRPSDVSLLCQAL